ncbi:MAG TPA: flagellin [Stellaceae bacterium]|nr:flagellin [Stellaceae bacterium]
MSNDVTLTAAARNILLTLQGTQSQMATSQNALATGQKVSSVTDNAVAYFQAQSLNNRANDFTNYKSGIDQGISGLQAALNATSGINSILQQMKGIVQAAESQSPSQRAAATAQFNELGAQIAQLTLDASYQGLNLLSSSSNDLKVQFSERSSASFLEVTGFALVNGTSNAAAGTENLFTDVLVYDSAMNFHFSIAVQDTGLVVSVAGFSSMDVTDPTSGANMASAFAATINRLDNAISNLQGISASLGTNVAILQTRLSFSSDYINTLTDGANKLTLADLNEEAANLQALQTRQQLGIQALSISGQQQQAILQLLH